MSIEQRFTSYTDGEMIFDRKFVDQEWSNRQSDEEFLKDMAKLSRYCEKFRDIMIGASSENAIYTGYIVDHTVFGSRKERNKWL